MDWVALASVAVIGLVSNSADAATEVRLVVARYSAATEAVFQGMATDFEAANPGVDIKVEVVRWDDLQQRLTTAISGGTEPDLAIIGTRWLLDYVTNDIAEPLDAWLRPEMKGRFIESLLASSTIDGQIWGLPVAVSARAMYYNTALLTKAGVGGPPATWDALVGAARKVKATGPDTYGFALQGKGIETDAYWYHALWTHGGELIDGGRSGVAGPAGVSAATLYKSMIDEGLTQPDPTRFSRQDVEALFKTGRAAMVLSGPWLRGQIRDEVPTLDYAIAPIPAGTTRATYGVTDSIMMFKSSEVKETAWKFLAETAFSPRWRIELTLREGFLPVTKAEAEQPAFKDDAQLKAFSDLLPYSRFAPLVPSWEEMADATSGALQRIYLGEAEPQAALGEAAAEIDGLLQR